MVLSSWWQAMCGTIGVLWLSSLALFKVYAELDAELDQASILQTFEGKRFHPNCGWRTGECLETKEVWQEFWTLRKIYKGEELTIDYGTNYPRTYKTAYCLDKKKYGLIPLPFYL